jgi:hypothetical protein
MSTVYARGLQNAFQGNYTWLNDTFRVALIDDTTAYSPSPGTELYVDDVLDGGTTATEFSDASYSRQTISTDVNDVGNDSGNTQVFVEADDVVFPNLTGGTVQGVLVYKQEGGDDTTPSDDYLIAYLDGPDYPASTNGEDFVVDFADDGSNSAGNVFTVSY